MQKCCKCDLEMEAKPHNFSHRGQRRKLYKCDGCISLEAKYLVLEGLKKIAHNISFEKIKSIFDEVQDNSL